MTVPALPRALLGFGLAAIVGYVDTLGFIEILGYLLAEKYAPYHRGGFMAIFSVAGPALALVLAFVIGVVAGSLTGHWAQRNRRQFVLAFATSLFAVAASLNAFGQAGSALFAMAIALGSLNGVLEDETKLVIGFFALIGRFSEELASIFTRTGSFGGLMADMLLWLGLFVGILGGLVLYAHYGLGAVWLAAAFAGLLAFGSVILPTESDPKTQVLCISTVPESDDGTCNN